MLNHHHHHFRDLLSKDGEKLDIKINPDGTGQLHVPGLRIIEVKSFQHIKKVTQHAGHPHQPGNSQLSLISEFCVMKLAALTATRRSSESVTAATVAFWLFYFEGPVRMLHQMNEGAQFII